MPEEGFLRRWARVKATGADVAPEPPPAAAPAPAPSPAPSPASTSTVARWARAGDVPQPVAAPEETAGEPSAAPARPSPTLEDVAQLTPDSDYSVFVGKGVDKSVQRLALKKLFADPHFNVPDRLDMYMDDYNIPSPVSAEMLASLDHARSALRRFVEDDPAAPPVQADGDILVAPAESDESDVSTESAESAAPQAATPPTSGQQAVPHNEAAHATAAHDDSPAGDTAPHTSSRPPTLDHGPFHRPNQQLHQLQQLPHSQPGQA